MSSDPNRPNPEWWKQPAPQENKADQEAQDDQDRVADQGYQGPQGNAPETQAVPRRNAGYPQAGQGYPQETRAYQQGGFPPGNQGFPQDQGYQQGQGFPQDQGYQQGQGFPQGGQDYQGTRRLPDDQAYTTPAAQGYQAPAAQGYQAPVRMRRRRRKWPLITLVVIIVILVIGDRAANAYTENQMASQFQSSLALSGKPHVTIAGFPFLTQLAARDFRTVNVNATDETTGPIEIASLTATLHGMHIRGLNSVTIDQFNASALVTFAALAKVGGVPEGVTLSADGPDKVKANLDVGFFSDTAVAQVTKTGPGQINVKIVDAGGIPASALGSLANFNVNIPKLPAGVAIQSVSVTQQGIRITATGHNTTLSQ